MAHRPEFDKEMAGAFRVRFRVNSEIIFATEGCAPTASPERRASRR